MLARSDRSRENPLYLALCLESKVLAGRRQGQRGGNPIDADSGVGIRSSVRKRECMRGNQVLIIPWETAEKEPDGIAAKVTGPDRQQQLKLAPTFKFRLAISRWPSGCRLLWVPSHDLWLNKQTLQTCTNVPA